MGFRMIVSFIARRVNVFRPLSRFLSILSAFNLHFVRIAPYYYI